MLKPEIKAKFLEALRSGKYTHVRGRFRDWDKTTCMCATGVLIDITRPDAWAPIEDSANFAEGFSMAAWQDEIGLTTNEFWDIVACNDLDMALGYEHVIQYVENKL